LQSRVSSPNRWRRLNIANPGKPFQLVARQRDPSVAFAFTEIVESTRGSWLAGKLLAQWSTWRWFGIGVLALGAIGLSVALSGRSALGAELGPFWRWLPWIALFAYANILVYHLDVYAGGADSSGYLNSARLLGEGAFSTPVLRPAAAGIETLETKAFIPPGFAPIDATRMVPTYPVGLPLLFLCAEKILPVPLAVGAVNLAHMLAGLLLIRALARLAGLPKSWGWIAAGWLALCPVYLFMGLQPMSDVAALVWVTAAVVCAWQSESDRRWAWVAGFATALAIMIRPTNLLVFVPVVLCLGLSWQRLVRWIAGGIPGALALAWYNTHAYGHPFRTGYGDPRGLFSSEWIGITLTHYAEWLPKLLTPFVALALALPFLRSVPGRTRLMLTSWALVYLGLYATYYCTHETWWYLRFVLPAMPALIVMALLAFRTLLTSRHAPETAAADGHRRHWRWFFPAAALGWLVSLGLHLDAFDSWRGNQRYRDAAQWLETHSPRDAVVVSDQHSGALLFYTRRGSVHPDNSRDADVIASAAARAGLPVYAIVHPFEQKILRWFPGHWQPLTAFDNITLWRWIPPGQVTAPTPKS
jgi:hypothetical protein